MCILYSKAKNVTAKKKLKKKMQFLFLTKVLFLSLCFLDCIKSAYFRNVKITLKVVSTTTFLVVCFVCLKESTCDTNVVFFTSKALFVLEITKFLIFLSIQMS